MDIGINVYNISHIEDSCFTIAKALIESNREVTLNINLPEHSVSREMIQQVNSNVVTLFDVKCSKQRIESSPLIVSVLQCSEITRLSFEKKLSAGNTPSIKYR